GPVFQRRVPGAARGRAPRGPPAAPLRGARAPRASLNRVGAALLSGGRAAPASWVASSLRSSRRFRHRRTACTAADDRVDAPARVGLRVVDGVVEPAALAAVLCARDDAVRDGGDVAQLGEVAGQEHVPVVLADLLLEGGDALPGACEPPVAAHDADVVPHETPDLVPVL